MSSRTALLGEFDELARKKEQERIAFNQLDPVLAQKQAESILNAKSYKLNIPPDWGSRFASLAD